MQKTIKGEYMNPKVAAILDELTTEVSKMQEKELKIE